jgi:RNA polymerase sigma-70 factor (ECF subfamily)
MTYPPDRAEGPAPTDSSLLRRLRAGEQDAATAMYLRYARRIRGLAEAKTGEDLRTRLDPDDIVQSVFRTFFRRAVGGQYEVPAGEDLWRLLLVISLNKVRAAALFHRAAMRDVRQTAGGEALAGAEVAGPEEESFHQLRLTVEEVLGRLPPHYREVIEARIEGLEVGEIAARTGRARRSIERLLQEFRHTLHGLIHEP